MKMQRFSVALAVWISMGFAARAAASTEPVQIEAQGEADTAGDDHAGHAHVADDAHVEHADDAAHAEDAAHAGHAATASDVHGAQGHAEHPDPSLHYNFTNLNYRGKDEYGGPFGDNRMVTPEGQVIHQEEPMSPPFLLLVLNFALLVVILVKYLWPAAGKLAEDRHTQIKGALDEAAKLRDQAKQKLAEYELRIKDVDREIKALVDGIRADAEADRARMLEAAAAQATQMKKDADQRIAAEIEIARAQLTKEVTAAAAQAAEKLLKDKTTVDDQHKLVSSFISGISGAN